jgi:RHS repeat-associated protein
LELAFTYDSFGQILAPTALSDPFTRYSFTGRERDTESNLYYFRNRYYDPRTGRFTSVDPLYEHGSGQKSYRYVLNSPINLDDPYGLRPGKKCEGAAVEGCVVCDGNDGFKVEMGEYTPQALFPCITIHEEEHVEWIKKRHPKWCCGKPEGTMVRVPTDEKDPTECLAYQAEKMCLTNTMNAGNWQAYRKREGEVDTQIKKYCHGNSR